MTSSLDNRQALDPAIWLDEHGDYLYRYALLRTRDSSAAEDLVQETLLAAVRSCQKQEQPASERSWLERILRQKLVEHFRRTAKPGESLSAHGEERHELDLFERSGEWRGHWREDRAPVGWPVSATELIEGPEFWQTFDRCLSDLPRRAAIAFTLREIDGLSTEEICELLDMSHGDLCVMLHCSRARLRQALENERFRGQDPHSPKLAGRANHRSGDVASYPSVAA